LGSQAAQDAFIIGICPHAHGSGKRVSGFRLKKPSMLGLAQPIEPKPDLFRGK
jgi:hypothetical protein